MNKTKDKKKTKKCKAVGEQNGPQAKINTLGFISQSNPYMS